MGSRAGGARVEVFGVTVQPDLNNQAIEALLKSTEAPDISLDEIVDRVRAVYGLEGSWSQLGAGREQNFRLVASDGTLLAVKVAHPNETPEGLTFEAEALEHVAR